MLVPTGVVITVDASDGQGVGGLTGIWPRSTPSSSAGWSPCVVMNGSKMSPNVYRWGTYGCHCPHSSSALLAALAVVERWLVKVGCEDGDGGLLHVVSWQ